MERSSHKSHVVDVTTTDADVIHHEEHIYWDEGMQNTCLQIYFVYFYHPYHRGSPAGKPTWCFMLQELRIVKPVDSCYITRLCISGEL